MSVRLLAGPFPITDDKGVAPYQISNFFWYPNVGLLMDTFRDVTDSSSDYLSIATMDGIYQPISRRQPHFIGWWPEKGLVIVDGSNIAPGPEETFEPIALVSQVVADGIDFTGTGFTLFPVPYVRLSDRRIYVGNSDIHGVVLDVLTSPPSFIDTIEGPTIPFSGPNQWVRPGRTPQEIFIVEDGSSYSQCRGIFYDTQKRVFTSGVYHINQLHCNVVYAPEFNVFVSVQPEGSPLAMTTRVWSLEVVPSTLSAPILLSGSTKQGQLATYQVQLLGDFSDPCVGELVDWSLLTNVGTLLIKQSVTDANGYATTQVGFKLNATGTCDVRASVTL
jgi:hypothetical protein